MGWPPLLPMDGPMSPPSSLEDLEKRVARLEQIVNVLAKASGVRIENPVDNQSVTRKTTFDWQTREERA